MAVENLICKNCDHYEVCILYKNNIAPFLETKNEASKVNITINKCMYYKEVE